MTNCRVQIYRDLSEYQQQLVDAGFPLIWVAVDVDQNDVFEHYDLTRVTAYANANKNVEYISKYVNAGNLKK